MTRLRARNLLPAFKRALDLSGRLRPVWVYIALEEGVDYTYPAMGDFSKDEDHDPRTRLWYTAAKAANGRVIWVGPYDDAYGRGSVISCSAAIKDDKGKFLGVAGFDLLEDFVKSHILRVTEQQPYDAFLVDGQGKVLIPDGPENLPTDVVDRIRERERNVRTDDKLMAYFPLHVNDWYVNDWYYVVVANPDRIQEVLDSMRGQQNDSQ